MTEDRDFKKVVRTRSAKTGESYQAARRQLEREPARLSARVGALWAHPTGLVLGCVVDAGRMMQGMTVAVVAGDRVVHEGTVVSLRRGKEEQAVVSSGECGILLDPPFLGYVPLDQDAPQTPVPGALKPVAMSPTPDRVVASA